MNFLLENDFIRCENCFLIPEIKLERINKILKINLICKNEHKKIYNLDKFFYDKNKNLKKNEINLKNKLLNYKENFNKENEILINNEKIKNIYKNIINNNNLNFLKISFKSNIKYFCSDCGKNPFEIKNLILFLCKNCKIFLCNECLLNHPKTHSSINLLNIDDFNEKIDDFNEISENDLILINNKINEYKNFILNFIKIILNFEFNQNYYEFINDSIKEIFFIEKNLNFYLISKQNNFFNLYLIKTIKNLISFEFLKIDLNLDKNTIINFLNEYFNEKTSSEKKIIKNTIKNSSFNNNNNNNEIIKINEKNFLIKNIYCFKRFKSHENYVTSLIIIKNYLISSSTDTKIKVFNLTNLNFLFDINEHYYGINHLNIINEEKFIFLSSGTDSLMKLIKIYEENINNNNNNKKYEIIQILKGHFSSVNKSILLSNNKIASCSWDKNVIIWNNINNNNYFYQIETILFSSNEVIDSICECDNYQLITYCFILQTLQFWNFNNMNLNKKMFNVKLNSKNDIYVKIKVNIIAICGYFNEGIYIINTNTYTILNKIKINNGIALTCIKKLNNFLFIGDDEGKIIQLEINDLLEIKKISEKKNIIDKGKIFCILLYKNEFIITCGEEKIIKLWK